MALDCFLEVAGLGERGGQRVQVVGVLPFRYLASLGGQLNRLFAVYLLGYYSSYIICLKLRPKWQMRNVILRFGIVRVLGTAFCFLLWILTSSIIFIILGYFFICFFGGYAVFEFPLLYLSIDEDEVIHGTRRDGMFQGLQALFNKPALSIGPIIATMILVSFGYIQGSTIQPQSALLGITILFLVYPTVVIAMSLIFIYLYPLHGEKLEEMESKLNEIHKRKRETLQ